MFFSLQVMNILLTMPKQKTTFFTLIQIFSFSNLLPLSVPDVCYSGNVSCTLNFIFTFFMIVFFYLILNKIIINMYVSYHLILPKKVFTFLSLIKLICKRKLMKFLKLQQFVHAIKNSMTGTPKKDCYSLSLSVITYKPPLLSF